MLIFRAYQNRFKIVLLYFRLNQPQRTGIINNLFSIKIKICEWDAIRDEQLIFHERLLQAGVRAELAFYEGCHHGSVTILDKNKGGYDYSLMIFKNTVAFLKQEL
jgi:acetyl esterase/lipase